MTTDPLRSISATVAMAVRSATLRIQSHELLVGGSHKDRGPGPSMVLSRQGDGLHD